MLLPKHPLALLAAIGVPLIGGFLVGTKVVSKNVGWWYEFLRKPVWTPPSGVFAPVWAVLYVMMGIASYIVYVNNGDLALYALQLAMNMWWSVLFFGNHNLRGASVEVVVLLAAVLATVKSFWAVTPLAGALMLPYAAWTAFAAALTLTVSTMNPQP